MKRAEILEAARVCVCGEREQDYGTPENSFGLIGQLWTAYMGTLFTAKDVAMMLALLKVARIKYGDKADSFVDLAGYAALDARVNTLIKVLKYIIAVSGFEMINRIELRDKKSGRCFR